MFAGIPHRPLGSRRPGFFKSSGHRILPHRSPRPVEPPDTGRAPRNSTGKGPAPSPDARSRFSSFFRSPFAETGFDPSASPACRSAGSSGPASSIRNGSPLTPPLGCPKVRPSVELPQKRTRQKEAGMCLPGGIRINLSALALGAEGAGFIGASSLSSMVESFGGMAVPPASPAPGPGFLRGSDR